MKKLVLTAAFTLVGVIAVSAQTDTTQQNPSQTQNPNNQTTTQTQQGTQAASDWGANSALFCP